MKRKEKLDFINIEKDDIQEEAFREYEKDLEHQTIKIKTDQKRIRKASLDSYRKMNTSLTRNSVDVSPQIRVNNLVSLELKKMDQRMAHSSMLSRTAMKTRRETAARFSQHSIDVYAKVQEKKEEQELHRVEVFMKTSKDKLRKMARFEKRKQDDLKYKLENQQIKLEQKQMMMKGDEEINKAEMTEKIEAKKQKAIQNRQ